MEKYNNKYRSQSHRKPNWDYSANSLYFLTIVTQNRICNLGEIVETHGRVSSFESEYKMKLSDFGKIVEHEWFKSFEIRNELLLDEFEIMPNHIHAIVEIYNVETHGRVSLSNKISNSELDTGPCIFTENIDINLDTRPCVSTGDVVNIKRNPPIRLPKSISSFIAGFKSSVNSKIDDYIDKHQLSLPKYNRNNHFFQPNYHDHIIRNNIEYQNIKAYIFTNPMNWQTDKLFIQ